MQHRHVPSQLEGRYVECVLADDVDRRGRDRVEHRRERPSDAGRRGRFVAARHDERRGCVVGRRHSDQPDTFQLGRLGAVQGDLVTAANETQRQVADERLRAA